MIQSIEIDVVAVGTISDTHFIPRRITASGRYHSKAGKSIEYKVVLTDELRDSFLDLCGAIEQKFFVELETEIRQEYGDGSGSGT